MWEELPDGAQRFAVGSDDANIQVQGFRVNGTGSPDTLFVAINSLRPWKASDAPTNVDLSWVTKGTSFGSVAFDLIDWFTCECIYMYLQNPRILLNSLFNFPIYTSTSLHHVGLL